MNYRHAFHAGNFADVHKHVLLVALLEHLQRKDTPFLYLDTHAGRGRYLLDQGDAAHSGEWRSGIGRIIDEPSAGIPEIDRYLEIVRADRDPDHAGRSYPGSPLIAAAILRPHDRAVCVEQVPAEAQALRSALRGRRRFAVECGDGHQALKSHLPPQERRGLVLIDPPYESAAESDTLADAMLMAHERWPTGIYAAWYPVKRAAGDEPLRRKIGQAGIRKVLCCELRPRPRDSIPGLNGSGLLIVNPPWQLDDRANTIGRHLLSRLADDGSRGTQTVGWLTPE